MTTKEFAKILQDKLTSEYGVDLSVASHQQIYRALALICRQMMSENHKKFQSRAIGTGSKQVYYLCMEFLMGRSLKMSLFNLGLNDAAQKALAEADISLDSIYEEEPDAGLGNGGLGRLAACYLDSMTTLEIPAEEEAFGQLLALLQEPSYSRTFAKDDQFTLGYVVYLSFATEETWAWTYHFQGGKLIQAGPTDQTKTYQISGGQATQEKILDFLLAQR